MGVSADPECEVLQKYVVIEPLLKGEFRKISHNSGQILLADGKDVCLRSEAYMHFTWEKSDHNLIITDIQGVGYALTDPEVASVKNVIQVGEKEFKVNYCRGNCGKDAIAQFAKEHTCNLYCTALDLPKMGFAGDTDESS